MRSGRPALRPSRRPSCPPAGPTPALGAPPLPTAPPRRSAPPPRARRRRRPRSRRDGRVSAGRGRCSERPRRSGAERSGRLPGRCRLSCLHGNKERAERRAEAPGPWLCRRGGHRETMARKGEASTSLYGERPGAGAGGRRQPAPVPPSGLFTLRIQPACSSSSSESLLPSAYAGGVRRAPPAPV